ncbi:FitA-like ribbon-helix-helix domain-containing protein [Glycomyces xiaoerkulensis]|uniref:FitA-like ribbon-helix-helix domain-containing protein n=1 Tax=Glycomyces xiaoerkulensis TaxID=2038139 RepID=UPI0018E4B309|nr:hypothetical protein [Glycomyces xiaoerkulensis]
MTTLYVRDVPEELMARLRSRAEEAHQSVQGYVRSLLDRELSVLTMTEAAQRAEQIAAGGGVTSDDILAAIEEERAEHE